MSGLSIEDPQSAFGKSAARWSDCVIIPHISIVSAYINDGGQSSSVTGRKTAFIQIDFLDRFWGKDGENT